MQSLSGFRLQCLRFLNYRLHKLLDKLKFTKPIKNENNLIKEAIQPSQIVAARVSIWKFKSTSFLLPGHKSQTQFCYAHILTHEHHVASQPDLNFHFKKMF